MTFPSPCKILGAGPVVMVDDSKPETKLATICFERSIVRNPWMTFSNGFDFLDYLSSVKDGSATMPALVLLDINMPKMNGFEVLKRVRSDSFFETLPIFMMLTTSPDPRDVELSKQAGASGFKRKPENLSEYTEFFNSLAAEEPATVHEGSAR